MIDPVNHDLVTLREATRFFPKINDNMVPYKTVLRWARDGVRGIRLETTMFIGQRVTTREAVVEFIHKCSRQGATA